MSTEFRNKDFKNKELSKCPVTGAGTTAKFSAGRGQSNRDFWPNSLNLKILSQHSNMTNPMDKKFNYAKEFKKLNYNALKRDLSKLMRRIYSTSIYQALRLRILNIHPQIRQKKKSGNILMQLI